jgi:hypothetical protein
MDKKLTKRYVAGLIRKGAKWLEENQDKHIAGTYHRNGSYCAIGAVVSGAINVPEEGDGAYYPDEFFELERAIVGSFRGATNSGPGLAHVNDAKVAQGDKQSVVRALRKTARFLEHGGGWE